MRVVAGTARGLRLVAPPGLDTRPTGDRVREAIFNALGSLAVLDGACVLDLFAGSGALGIEALSRGAATATFVDHDPRAIDVIRQNLAGTGVGTRATVVAQDALRFTSAPHGPFGLALLDPPYAFVGWADLLCSLAASTAVIESDRPVDAGEGWRLVRQKRYGTTVVSIVRRSSADPQE